MAYTVFGMCRDCPDASGGRTDCGERENARRGGIVNTDHLRECVYLASTLSFTDTAKHYFVTQPVLSRHVSGVESELGFPLFIRTKNGISLTPVGRDFLQTCGWILGKYDRAIEDAHFSLTGLSRPINIGYLYGASSHFLPRAIQAFKREHPQSLVRYFSYEIDEILGALDDNRIDIAVTSCFQVPSRDKYQYLDLYDDSLCVVAPLHHPLASLDCAAPGDLKSTKVILPAASFMSDESSMINAALAPVVSSLDTMPLIVDLDSVKMSLMVEDCVAIEFSHLKHVFGDEFVFIPLKATMPNFSVMAVWKRESETQAIKDLAQAMASASSQG